MYIFPVRCLFLKFKFKEYFKKAILGGEIGNIIDKKNPKHMVQHFKHCFILKGYVLIPPLREISSNFFSLNKVDTGSS